MSLNGGSELSTIINNIVVVVPDGILNGNSTTTLTPSPTSSHLPTEKPVETDGVATGISQGQITAVAVMLISFSIFGCLGNGLVLYVFTKKSDKVTSTIFILALAWTDFFTCLLVMPFTTANILLNSYLVYDVICKLYQFLITCNVPLSAFIMVAISVDRYFSICHPFLHVVTPRRARIAIICLVIFAFSLGSITSCMYSVYSTGYKNETAQMGNASWCYNGTTEAEAIIYDNATDSEICWRTGEAFMYREGQCKENEYIFSMAFMTMYQKVYISFYFISLLIVFTLYFFIYRSVVKRRAWRRKQKSWSHSPMSGAMNTVDNGKHKTAYTDYGENMELAPKDNTKDASHPDLHDDEGDGEGDSEGTGAHNTGKTPMISSMVKDGGQENGLKVSALSAPAERKSNRERRDFNFFANIRTAIMLFVVAVVFIVSFLPAWLMATLLIEYQIIVFYSHYIYNVANPVIYAFMNQAFRKELKRVFQRGTPCLRSG